MSPEMIQDQTPGIYPAADKGKDQVAAGPGFQNFRIVGKLAGVQGNKIQVIAGRPLLIELAETAVIKVSAGDTTFCMPGDEVQINGLRNPAQENWIQAESLTITGAKPLSPPEKATRGSRRDRTRRAAEESAEAPEAPDAP